VLLARRVGDSAAWSMRTVSSRARVSASWPPKMARIAAAADQVGQAAGHAAGALVQVFGLDRRRARLVMVQLQGGFQRGDQLGHSSR
jgi:hypothetical protein